MPPLFLPFQWYVRVPEVSVPCACGPLIVCPFWFSIANERLSVSGRAMRKVRVSRRPSLFGLNGSGDTEVILGCRYCTVKLALAVGPLHVAPVHVAHVRRRV